MVSAIENGRVQLHFAVFSFNRAEFLVNCLRSLEQCAPHIPVTVFDDNSTDAATIAVLADIRQRASQNSLLHLVQPSVQSADPGAGQSKHGGLYHNMQLALDSLPDDTLMCTLQDDMQLVRPLTDEDVAAIQAYFAVAPNRAFLHQAFIKASELRRSQVEYDAADDTYMLRRARRSAGCFYSDICIAHVGRLRAVRWKFLPRESLNEKQAHEKFATMAYLANPFVAWLPSAPAWRGKQRTLALRLGEKYQRCGYYPFLSMTDEESLAFCARERTVLPVAEQCLRLDSSVALKQPWVYHPLQGSRWLKWLNSAELKLRR
tara:strand:+ start:6689 stop:7642 length:954 start_codon:yes stop_codon:yes gene_type:complete